MRVPVMDGITAETVTTSRLTTRVLTYGDKNAVPVLFLHGNISSATWWEEVMLSLPDGFRGIAYDQRGYGDSDPDAKIDATRGLGDLADDAVAMLDYFGIDKVHLVGQSAGGCTAWWMMRKYPERLLSVTQVAPGSPFGFAATKDVEGNLTTEDAAGSGGGLIAPPVIEAMKAQDTSTDSPFTMRSLLRSTVVNGGIVVNREDEIVQSMLSTHIGEEDYPGDKSASPNWPYVGPGVKGMNNALSPKYMGDVSEIYRIDPKPSVLWIRGDKDGTVSDTARADMAVLGKAGLIPGYPGEDVFPPQPMIHQIRYVLDNYAEAGGEYSEVVLENIGHGVFIEDLEAFNEHFHKFLQNA